jgi:hypothetical protein
VGIYIKYTRLSQSQLTLKLRPEKFRLGLKCKAIYLGEIYPKNVSLQNQKICPEMHRGGEKPVAMAQKSR